MEENDKVIESELVIGKPVGFLNVGFENPVQNTLILHKEKTNEVNV